MKTLRELHDEEQYEALCHRRAQVSSRMHRRQFEHDQQLARLSGWNAGYTSGSNLGLFLGFIVGIALSFFLWLLL